MDNIVGAAYLAREPCKLHGVQTFFNYKDAYNKSMNNDGKTEYDFLLDVYLKATNYRNDK